MVSIHAPAWGATFCRMRCAGRPLSFNPRARVGRDYAEKDERNWSYMFQSTRPRGARPGIKYNGVEIFYVSIHAPAWGATLNGLIGYRCSGSFNPRARVGRDRMIGMICFSPAVFQSTRPRGARLFARLSWSPSLHVSIHAPAWGDKSCIAPIFIASCFNPRARVGRDIQSSQASGLCNCFNPRARVGRDLIL